MTTSIKQVGLLRSAFFVRGFKRMSEKADIYDHFTKYYPYKDIKDIHLSYYGPQLAQMNISFNNDTDMLNLTSEDSFSVKYNDDEVVEKNNLEYFHFNLLENIENHFNSRGHD